MLTTERHQASTLYLGSGLSAYANQNPQHPSTSSLSGSHTASFLTPALRHHNDSKVLSPSSLSRSLPLRPPYLLFPPVNHCRSYQRGPWEQARRPGDAATADGPIGAGAGCRDTAGDHVKVRSSYHVSEVLLGTCSTPFSRFDSWNSSC